MGWFSAPVLSVLSPDMHLFIPHNPFSPSKTYILSSSPIFPIALFTILEILKIDIFLCCTHLYIQNKCVHLRILPLFLLFSRRRAGGGTFKSQKSRNEEFSPWEVELFLSSPPSCKNGVQSSVDRESRSVSPIRSLSLGQEECQTIWDFLIEKTKIQEKAGTVVELAVAPATN